MSEKLEIENKKESFTTSLLIAESFAQSFKSSSIHFIKNFRVSNYFPNSSEMYKGPNKLDQFDVDFDDEESEVGLEDEVSFSQIFSSRNFLIFFPNS